MINSAMLTSTNNSYNVSSLVKEGALYISNRLPEMLFFRVLGVFLHKWFKKKCHKQNCHVIVNNASDK